MSNALIKETEYVQTEGQNRRIQFGDIVLGDAYEVHKFVTAQDMFTMEDAIELVVAHNRAISHSAETTLDILKILGSAVDALRCRK